MTSAATQAPEPVMWCAMLKRPIAGPAPRVAANAKAQRPAVGAAAQPGGQAADRPHGRAGRHGLGLL